MIGTSMYQKEDSEELYEWEVRCKKQERPFYL